MLRTYSNLIKIDKFEDRVKYLRLNEVVGKDTFGGHRFLNQALYHSDRWRSIRRKVILRDNGCDLAHRNYMINGPVYVHHLNPITIDDILEENPFVFDLENLVCSSFKTHNSIHYGSKEITSGAPIIRRKNDTCPWR